MAFRESVPFIERRGLLPPAELARRAGIDLEEVLLRRHRLELALPDGPAVLNHQGPLLMGRNKDFIDGGDVRGWARQLDERVFLWPGGARKTFVASVEGAVPITLDAGPLYDRIGERIDLSPINSGQASRRPIRRGPWLYVPATAGAETFRENRRGRGLVRSPDNVTEVSVRGGIDAATLAACRIA